ncbi:SGNH/GDSL hydrolase family protein [Marinoscillum furvescens]|uniref:Lysophospholipase L1-like esterase n=1 Tax=Marinoscillum furvescens DSM 4134 TaxID=1122208 RepID=A0A3D9L475_MARFU|nr:SGNH/GDSL hydrolase family protein [Marinoscillum furvescens]REE00155.1 lysophospholipase L1-like esterase [Marinoscillum furvescens DSM 4134]
MNKTIIRVGVLLILLTTVAAFQTKKKQVLIIGDSISNGYTPFVQQNLDGIAEVVHNPGNGKHTGNGLKHIKDWIGETDWDIIHFNWGLWDLCYRHPESQVQGQRDKVNGTITYSLEEYETNLDSLVRLIKKYSDAELIFVTTTYVPEEEAGRFSEDAQRYNAVAKKIMKAHGVAVNDIYAKSRRIHRKYGKGDDDVHYTEKGSEKLGKHISNYLKKQLK